MPQQPKAHMRETLKRAGWRRLTARGAETWVDPNTATLYALVGAYERVHTKEDR